MEQALSVFPPWYDRISALAIVRQSLFEVGRPEVGREVGRVLERRVTAAVGCSTEP
jgi:hypothetical protein